MVEWMTVVGLIQVKSEVELVSQEMVVIGVAYVLVVV